MSEPKISATVYNTDVIYNATPLDTGIKIHAMIDTPSGSYDIRNTTGKSDLIRHYLTTSEITVENDDTVKQVGYLLDYSNIYTQRVGSIGMKQGVSSLGELLLFDANNELISKYYSLKINEWVDTLDYYYIAFGSTMWYTGDITDLDEITSNKYPNKIKVNDSKSVDLLVQNLYKHLLKDEITILKTNGNTILCRDALTFSNNLSVESIENYNKYKKVSNTEGALINQSEYLMLRDNVYYWQGDGTFQPTRFNNPVAIYSTGNTNNQYDAGLFFLRVMKIIQDNSTSYLPMPEIRGDGGLSISYKGVEGTWYINENCKTKLKLADNDKILSIYDADDLIDSGVVRVKFFKEALPEPEPVAKDIPSSYNADSGIATLTSNSAIKKETDTTYNITIPKIINTYGFQDNINSTLEPEGTTAVISFNIDSLSDNDIYEVSIKKIVSSEQISKEFIITLEGAEIKRQTIDFSSNTTQNDVKITDLKFTGIGTVKISLEKATFTSQTVIKKTTSKVRKATLMLGSEKISEHTLDFTDGNTITDFKIEGFIPTIEDKLSFSLSQATFENGKIESIYKKTLTDDEKNGIDLTIQFVIGIASEVTPEGALDVTLTENSLTALGVIQGILDTIEVAESDEFDLDMTNFKCSTKGELTAYFEKRELIEKGTQTGNDIKSLKIENDIGFVTYQYDFLMDAYMKGSQKNTDFYIRIGGSTGTLFYVGKTVPPVECNYRARVSKDPVTYSEFMDLFLEQLASYYPNASTYQNEIAFSENVIVDANGVDFLVETESQQTSAQFAVLQNFTSDKDVFSMSYVKDDSITDYEVYNLTLGYKDNVETYDISFDKAAVDGYNRALYYDRIQNEYLTIKLLDGKAMLDELTTFKWGSDIKPKKASVTDYLNAINKIPLKENLWFDFLWDSGYAHPSVAIAQNNMCNKRFALGIVSLPTEYNYNKNDKSGYLKVTEYAANLALNDRYSRIVWAKIRSGNVGNFATEINGSTLALRNYISLYNSSGSEFCPQMGVNYGVLEGTHLILPEADIRNDLIDRFRIATVKGGDGVTAYHINDNTTTQSINTPFKEEQNVRTANAIVHIVDRIFYTYLGLKNDFITRNSLVMKCKEAITQRCVKNQIFSLDQLRIVCDESNNSEQDIANNILNLAVYGRFGRAIKFGNIYVNSLPLDTGSTQSV